MPILPRDEVACGIRIGSIEKVFRERRQYHVRFFQRAYVWNREDQWERVWTDICGKPDTRVTGERVQDKGCVLCAWGARHLR
jgi:hypothetical protein